MKRYEEYKDTGIGWLPKLPSHWKLEQLRKYIRLERFLGPRGVNFTARHVLYVVLEGDSDVFRRGICRRAEMHRNIFGDKGCGVEL